MIEKKLVRGDHGYNLELDEGLDDGSAGSKAKKERDKYSTIEIFSEDDCNLAYYKELFIDPEFDLSLDTVNRMPARDILDVVKNLIKARSALIARSKISGSHWVDPFLYLKQALKDVNLTKKIGVSTLYYFALKAKRVPEFGGKIQELSQRSGCL